MPSSVRIRVTIVERCVILYALPWYVSVSGTRIAIVSISAMVRLVDRGAHPDLCVDIDLRHESPDTTDGNGSSPHCRRQRRRGLSTTAERRPETVPAIVSDLVRG